MKGRTTSNKQQATKHMRVYQQSPQCSQGATTVQYPESGTTKLLGSLSQMSVMPLSQRLGLGALVNRALTRLGDE
jgi:hypothetical protein